MGDEREFGREHPPLAFEGEIAAPHVVQRDVLPAGDLGGVLAEPRPQRTLALRSPPRRLTDIDQAPLVVEGIDPAGRGTRAPRQVKERAAFELLDDLGPDPFIQIEDEVMFAVVFRHRMRDGTTALIVRVNRILNGVGGRGRTAWGLLFAKTYDLNGVAGSFVQNQVQPLDRIC